MTFLCFLGIFFGLPPVTLKILSIFFFSLKHHACRCHPVSLSLNSCRRCVFNYLCLKSLLNFKFIIILPEELNQPSQATTMATKLHKPNFYPTRFTRSSQLYIYVSLVYCAHSQRTYNHLNVQYTCFVLCFQAQHYSKLDPLNFPPINFHLYVQAAIYSMYLKYTKKCV